jgi:hypothetical protein
VLWESGRQIAVERDTVTCIEPAALAAKRPSSIRAWRRSARKSLDGAESTTRNIDELGPIDESVRFEFDEASRRWRPRREDSSIEAIAALPAFQFDARVDAGNESSRSKCIETALNALVPTFSGDDVLDRADLDGEGAYFTLFTLAGLDQVKVLSAEIPKRVSRKSIASTQIKFLVGAETGAIPGDVFAAAWSLAWRDDPGYSQVLDVSADVKYELRGLCTIENEPAIDGLDEAKVDADCRVSGRVTIKTGERGSWLTTQFVIDFELSGKLEAELSNSWTTKR